LPKFNKFLNSIPKKSLLPLLPLPKLLVYCSLDFIRTEVMDPEVIHPFGEIARSEIRAVGWMW